MDCCTAYVDMYCIIVHACTAVLLHVVLYLLVGMGPADLTLINDRHAIQHTTMNYAILHMHCNIAHACTAVLLYRVL
jgi:hypothetical protein